MKRTDWTAGELRSKNGYKVSFEDSNSRICEGEISVAYGAVHIVHNNPDANGDKAKDMRGYKFSWSIYNQGCSDSDNSNNNFNWIDIPIPTKFTTDSSEPLTPTILIDKPINTMTLKDKFKQLTLSEPKKTFVKAGMMNLDGNWSDEVKNYGRDLMINEFLATDKVSKDLLQIAKEQIKDK